MKDEKLVGRIVALEEGDTKNVLEILKELEKLNDPELLDTLQKAKYFDDARCVSDGFINFAQAIPNKDIFHRAREYKCKEFGECCGDK
jgi:hypothetical protein